MYVCICIVKLLCTERTHVMQVPMVTIQGDSFPSRVGASLARKSAHCNTLHHTATRCHMGNLFQLRLCASPARDSSRCSTLQLTVTRCHTPKHTETWAICLRRALVPHLHVSRPAATHYNMLQHTATRCAHTYGTRLFALEHAFPLLGVPLLARESSHWSTATYCNILAANCNTLQHTATFFSALQHTTTHCNTFQHTSAARHATRSFADEHISCL